MINRGENETHQLRALRKDRSRTFGLFVVFAEVLPLLLVDDG